MWLRFYSSYIVSLYFEVWSNKDLQNKITTIYSFFSGTMEYVGQYKQSIPIIFNSDKNVKDWEVSSFLLRSLMICVWCSIQTLEVTIFNPHVRHPSCTEFRVSITFNVVSEHLIFVIAVKYPILVFVSQSIMFHKFTTNVFQFLFSTFLLAVILMFTVRPCIITKAKKQVTQTLWSAARFKIFSPTFCCTRTTISIELFFIAVHKRRTDWRLCNRCIQSIVVHILRKKEVIGLTLSTKYRNRSIYTWTWTKKKTKWRTGRRRLRMKTIKTTMKMTLVIYPSNYHRKTETWKNKYDAKKNQLNFKW